MENSTYSKPQNTQKPILDLDWYREVVEGAPDLIDIIDEEGTILYTNTKKTPLDGSGYEGTTIYSYFFPEYHDLVRNKIKHVFETGEMDYYELATDYNRNHVSYFMTRLGPIIREGKVVAVMLFIRDITELKNVQERLNRLNEELENRVLDRTRVLQEYATRLEAAEKYNAALRHAKNRREVLEITADHFGQMLNADITGIYLVNGNSLEFSTSRNHLFPPPNILDPSHDRILYSLLNENNIKFLKIPGTPHDDCQFCEYIFKEKMRTLILAPLRTEETSVGIIYLGFRENHHFSNEEQQLVKTFVDSASNTLHRTQVMEQLETSIQNREQELDLLYDITSIASETDDLDTLLQTSLNKILSVVRCRSGLFHLFDRSDISKPAKVIQYPDDEILLRECVDVYEQDEPAILNMDTTVFRETQKEELTFMTTPLLAKNKPIGLLTLLGKPECLKNQETIHLVTTITEQLGLAVASVRQRKKADQALILEERQRLARDLHDSVSQSLYGLVISADVSSKLLKIKEYENLALILDDIEKGALQSLKEMRLMLFELRPLSFETEGLTGALELRLNTVEKRAGIETTLNILGEEYIISPLDLEVYRITTEALNNALKHANATSVQISINADSNNLTLSIRDNGDGFDHSNETGGIGLISMKERSSRINGILNVESNSGSGTLVTLHVPLSKIASG